MSKVTLHLSECGNQTTKIEGNECFITEDVELESKTEATLRYRYASNNFYKGQISFDIELEFDDSDDEKRLFW